MGLALHNSDTSKRLSRTLPKERTLPRRWPPPRAPFRRPLQPGRGRARTAFTDGACRCQSSARPPRLPARAVRVGWPGSPGGYSLLFYCFLTSNQRETYDQIDPRYYYNSTGATSNVLAAKKVIATFLANESLRPKSGANALVTGIPIRCHGLHRHRPGLRQHASAQCPRRHAQQLYRVEAGGLPTVAQAVGGIRGMVRARRLPSPKICAMSLCPVLTPDPATSASVTGAAAAGTMPAADTVGSTTYRAFWHWIEATPG